MGTKEPITLLTLPQEIRDEILSLALPCRGPVNLTEVRPHCKRWTWVHDNDRRCDPPVLSVNRELSSNALEMLYNREFVIDVDCKHLSIGSRFYRIVSHFPFQKVRQVTLRIGVGTQYDQEDINHLFDHLLHLVGLYFQDPNSVKKLGLQFYHVEDIGLRYAPCNSFEGVHNLGVANKLDLYPDFLAKMTQRIQRVLPALAICGQVSELLIQAPGQLSQNFQPQKGEGDGFYQKMTTAATAGRAGGSEVYRVMQNRYHDLLEAVSKNETQSKRNAENGYRLWLRRMYKKNPCKHAGPAEKLTRRGNRDSKCDGCMTWFRWLLECNECKLRLCVSCMQELRMTVRKMDSKKAPSKRIIGKGKAHHGPKHQGRPGRDAEGA
ncbi:MAG: hypothetical protein LQ350_006128 [Teloschistes chrysophthalmus]|nr:MAG: hypothetical protein LQ350_006128 [Niorma chrysophthalma]